MYLLKFKPVYKEVIWGGTKLRELFGRKLPGERIGESWEISTRDNGGSIVTNGPLAGKTLAELIASYPEKILGHAACRPDFPLLIKFIDARDKLSVQVHPDDEYARRTGGAQGKTEVWFVLDAAQDAQIVYGLHKGITKDVFSRAAQTADIMNCLRIVPVKTGDMVFVPAGLVHALLGETVVCEVQQNSDTTYRIYDYGRLGEGGMPRQLQLDKALEVIHFDLQPQANFSVDRIGCAYFSVEKLQIAGSRREKSDGNFMVYCVLTGQGKICTQNNMELLTGGDTLLIPACLQEVTLSGTMQVLKIT